MLQVLVHGWNPADFEVLLIQAELMVVYEPERVYHPEALLLALRPACHLLVKFTPVGLVDAAVAETALVGAFVDDHGIFHVVPRVGDNGNDCVGPVRVLPEVERIVAFGANEGK